MKLLQFFIQVKNHSAIFARNIFLFVCYLTVINSLALTVNVNRKGFLKMISEVIAMMFKPTTPFWTGRAMDLLFDGIHFVFKTFFGKIPSTFRQFY